MTVRPAMWCVSLESGGGWGMEEAVEPDAWSVWEARGLGLLGDDEVS